MTGQLHRPQRQPLPGMRQDKEGNEMKTILRILAIPYILTLYTALAILEHHEKKAGRK